MAAYNLDSVNKYKKLIKAEDDYWEEELSTEFCIARRTRDILIGRQIVNGFEQSKRTAAKKFVLDFQQETVCQEYFRTYIKTEATIGDFYAIFISPTEQFAEEYSKHDEVFFPKVLDAKESEQISEELKSSFHDLLKLFKKHRNTEFWENEKEWEWFFFQYLKFLVHNFSEEACRDGLGVFINVIIKMHQIVEKSGWKIDYGLYDNPVSVWGGQSLISKLQAQRTAKDLAKRLTTRLGFPTKSIGLRFSNRLRDYVLSYFVGIFMTSCFTLAIFLFADVVISTVFFMIYGYWTSVFQNAFTLFLERTDLFGPEAWRINTGLIGLNYLINEFVALQFSVAGRWLMFGISIFVTIVLLIIGVIFDIELMDKSSNPNTPKDASFIWMLGSISYMIILAPLVFGVTFGLLMQFLII